MDIRGALKVWRQRTSETQRSLAAKLGVSQQAVWNWENQDRHRPGLCVALVLERLTRGDVPVCGWGYSPDEVRAVRAAARQVRA